MTERDSPDVEPPLAELAELKSRSRHRPDARAVDVGDDRGGVGSLSMWLRPAGCPARSGGLRECSGSVILLRID